MDQLFEICKEQFIGSLRTDMVLLVQKRLHNEKEQNTQTKRTFLIHAIIT